MMIKEVKVFFYQQIIGIILIQVKIGDVKKKNIAGLEPQSRYQMSMMEVMLNFKLRLEERGSGMPVIHNFSFTWINN